MVGCTAEYNNSEQVQVIPIKHSNQIQSEEVKSQDYSTIRDGRLILSTLVHSKMSFYVSFEIKQL